MTSTVSPTSSERPATEVRTYHLRAILQQLGEVDPAVLDRVRARLGPEALATVDGASRLAWLPGAIDVALWRAVRDELGQAGLAQCARTVTLRHVRSGHLSGLLQGIIQLFGLTPGALVRWLPRGMSEIHRGVGTLRVEENVEGSARLVLDDLHPALVGEPWLEAVATSFGFALDLCALDGEAALERPGPDQAVMVLRWRPRAPRG